MRDPAARPDQNTRLRLVMLRTPRGETEFGDGLVCVPVAPDACTEVAHTIASSVIGPRPDDVDGTIEISGQLVSLRTLPAPLLRPSAAPTVDRLMLDDLWREICAQRRGRVEAAHASRRLLSYRSAAALEAARQRAALVAEELRAPGADLTISPALPDPPLDEVTPRLVSLCDWIDSLAPVESPEALALADAFDELGAAAEAADTDPVPDAVDLEELEARVAVARVNAARIAGHVPPDARARIEACHHTVVAAESALFESRRKDRPSALARYQQALAAERAVLMQAGVDSYASFLVAIAQGTGAIDPAERLRAELELADAEAAVRRARARLDAPEVPSVEERAVELRARAAQLLGRFATDDAATDLRALRVEHPDRAVRMKELRELLAELGEAPAGDIVAFARSLAAQRTRQAEEAAAAATSAMPVAPSPEELAAAAAELAEEQRALDEEIAALTRDCAEHHEAIVVLERDLAYVDQVSAFDLGSIELNALDALFDALFGSYRAGDLLAGRLPLVLDGALDDLEPARVDAVVDRLAAVDDIQVIVVAADPKVADALDRVGAYRSSWSNGHQAVVPPEPGSEPAPVEAVPVADGAPSTRCQVHADKDAAAVCAQCGRPSCVGCLVYMPGEPELTCRACAEAMHGRTLRSLRRRGA